MSTLDGPLVTPILIVDLRRITHFCNSLGSRTARRPGKTRQNVYVVGPVALEWEPRNPEIQEGPKR